MECVLTVDNLSKRYKNFKALDGLSMHIEKGAIYGFVGKNGAGKTTLIRLICGLQNPTSGGFSLYGTKNTEAGIMKTRRRMGAVVETPSVYLDMTAEDNLKAQYRVLGLPSFEGIPELIKLVGLDNTGRKKAKNFSYGMRQRLGIAVALAGDPDFLVLDEPINGLDPEGIIEMRELILKLNRERQITVLISSHILDELSRLATHYGFIDHGQMVKEISAAELEAACRKCVRLTVSDVKALTRTLDGMRLDYSVVSETEADVFGKVNVSSLTMALYKENCEVLSMHEHDESLESYYISLIGVARVNKLLTVNFARLKKDKIFWLGAAFMFAAGAFGVIMKRINDPSAAVDQLALLFPVFIGIVSAAFCSLYIGTEYSDGTIRNKLIVGHTRKAVYMSNFITCSTAGVIMCLSYIVAVAGLGLPLLGLSENNIGALGILIIVALIMVIATTALLTLLCMLNQNKAISAVVCILLIVALLVLAAMIKARLNAPQYYDSYIVTDSLGNSMTEKVLNPQYLTGTKREVYQFFLDFLPTGQAIEISTQETPHLWRLPLYSLFITLTTTVSGVLCLRKKDLK